MALLKMRSIIPARSRPVLARPSWSIRRVISFPFLRRTPHPRIGPLCPSHGVLTGNPRALVGATPTTVPGYVASGRSPCPRAPVHSRLGMQVAFLRGNIERADGLYKYFDRELRPPSREAIRCRAEKRLGEGGLCPGRDTRDPSSSSIVFISYHSGSDYAYFGVAIRPPALPFPIVHDRPLSTPAASRATPPLDPQRPRHWDERQVGAQRRRAAPKVTREWPAERATPGHPAFPWHFIDLRSAEQATSPEDVRGTSWSETRLNRLTASPFSRGAPDCSPLLADVPTTGGLFASRVTWMNGPSPQQHPRAPR